MAEWQSPEARPAIAPDRRGKRRCGTASNPSARGRGVRRSSARRHCAAEARRPRLHPLHIRVHRQAEGGDAFARERDQLRRLVLGIFQPQPDDRFSSHAPFHFDLSILDIYVPLKHGATLVLIGEDIGKRAAALWPR